MAEKWREGIVCPQVKPSQAGRDVLWLMVAIKKSITRAMYLRISSSLYCCCCCRHSVCMSVPVRVEVRFVEVTWPLLAGSGSKQLGCLYNCDYCSSAISLLRDLPPPPSLMWFVISIVTCHIR